MCVPQDSKASAFNSPVLHVAWTLPKLGLRTTLVTPCFLSQRMAALHASPRIITRVRRFQWGLSPTHTLMYGNTCSSAGGTVEGGYELLGHITRDRLTEFSAPAFLQFALFPVSSWTNDLSASCSDQLRPHLWTLSSSFYKLFGHNILSQQQKSNMYLYIHLQWKPRAKLSGYLRYNQHSPSHEPGPSEWRKKLETADSLGRPMGNSQAETLSFLSPAVLG